MANLGLKDGELDRRRQEDCRDQPGAQGAADKSGKVHLSDKGRTGDMQKGHSGSVFAKSQREWRCAFLL